MKRTAIVVAVALLGGQALAQSSFTEPTNALQKFTSVQELMSSEAWPEGWPAPEGLPIAQPFPSLENLAPPEGWSLTDDDWQLAKNKGRLVPFLKKGVVGLAVVLGFLDPDSDESGFCWDRGLAYSEGKILDGQKCVCETYIFGPTTCSWEASP